MHQEHHVLCEENFELLTDMKFCSVVVWLMKENEWLLTVVGDILSSKVTRPLSC